MHPHRARLAALYLPHVPSWWQELADGRGDPADDDLGLQFVDVPPALARETLDLVGWDLADTRPHGQPSYRWLVGQAERYEGLLGGYVTPAHGFYRIDTIAVPARHIAALTRDLVADWPADDIWEAATEYALACGWTSWESGDSDWNGDWRLLLEGPPPGMSVAGYWWD